MLATFISDVFRKSEIEQIAFALDDLCDPRRNFGWASAGLYCFWDIQSKEIYYIGLAVDLAQRFRQHTGLIPCDEKGCKIQQITKHFDSNELIGYTIFVQSYRSQPLVARIAQEQRMSVKDYETEYGSWTTQGEDEIRLIEGLLIEAHRKQGKHPVWNKIGGSKEGAAIQYPSADILLNFLNGTNSGPLLARSTLRELVTADEDEMYEEIILHVMRLNMLRIGMDYNTAFANVDDMTGLRARILEVDYLNKVPDLTGTRQYELAGNELRAL
ncbi:MAG: hypothetical protein SFU56_12735 [Capsulimonadales bacterium]|nr:hypothetical protein [Capsulimonadales bacterium]